MTRFTCLRLDDSTCGSFDYHPHVMKVAILRQKRKSVFFDGNESISMSSIFPELDATLGMQMDRKKSTKPQ